MHFSGWNAQNAVEDKPYDQFGKYVAAELRQLSQRHAILLQQEIQNCVTGSKLYCLLPKHYPHKQQIRIDVMSPCSSAGSTDSPSTLSTNTDYDILNQTMINSFRGNALSCV
jgi:hypothetical protein